jgi:signal transduction histidine kinase
MLLPFMNRRFSLSRDFFTFAVLVAVAVLGLSIWMAWSSYTTLEQERARRLSNEGERITVALREGFRYTENLFSFIASEIRSNNVYTPAAIAQVLKDNIEVSHLSEQIFTWTAFDFVLPDGSVVADSTRGVLKDFPKVTPEKRRWMVLAPQYPGKMVLSFPDIGIISNEPIIPAGYGVLDNNGTFRGILSMGFNVNKIGRKLESALRYPTSFVVLTHEGQLVLQSSDITTPFDVSVIPEKASFLKGKGWLTEPLVSKDWEFHSYVYLPEYDYTVLVGYNTLAAYAEFKQVVLPYLVLTLSLGAFFILVLYFFQRVVVAPLVKLSDTADQIARKEKSISFPRGNSYEVNNLIRALINVRRSFAREALLKHRLEEATIKANEANHAKSRFLANMSHELRTPLGAIIGFSELMKLGRKGEMNEGQAESVGIIHTSAHHLLELINNILNLSKVEAGKEELIESPFMLQKVFKGCMEFVEEAAAKRNIRVSCEMEDKDMALFADKIKVKQIVTNVLSNAVKFTEEGGEVSLTAAFGAEQEIIITVEDNGIGIREEDIDRILEEFGQGSGDAYTRKKQQGTGLGLAIVKNYVQLHGGALTIESALGRGTKVTITFPPGRTYLVRQNAEAVAENAVSRS